MDLKKLLRLLDLQSFVSFDFETTGLNPSHDSIIEFAAVRFRDGEMEDSISSLINPQIPIPAEITRITGITDDLVSKAPTEKEVIQDLVDFLGNEPIVAHNINFDLGFLKQVKSRYYPNFNQIDNVTYDTLFLAQSFLFFLPNHRLGTVTTYFDYPLDQAHRALSDATNAGYIFKHLIAEVASYPLNVIQKILSTLKFFPVSTKELFVNLANLLVKENLLNKGILQSQINKSLNTNVFVHQSKTKGFPETANEVFGVDGLFSKQTHFEVRPTQIEYSDFVNKIFSEKAIGITEAGTGLGKSLAYLLSGLRQSSHLKQGPTVISCFTKHLQDQLFFLEVPKLAETLNVSFMATLLKGRQNYLCRTRLNWLIEEAGNFLSPYDAQSLIPIIVWLSYTKTGDFDECPGFLNRRSFRVRELILSEIGYCTSQLCQNQSGCFLGPIREASRKADLVIINHSLLLSELSNPGILPSIPRVVIDEAHNFVKVAYDFFRISVSYQGIRNQLIYIDRSSKRSRGLSSQIEKIGQIYPEVLKQYAYVQDSVQQMLVSSEQLFSKLSINRAADYNKDAIFTQKQRYLSFEEQFSSLVSYVDDVCESFKSGIHEIEKLLNIFKGLPESVVEKEIVTTVENLNDSVKEILSFLKTTTIEQQEDWVYWEEGRFVDGELELSLNGVSIYIGKMLSEVLFHSIDSVVVTSATLRIGDSFKYIISRLGLQDQKEKKIYSETFSSPFKYDEQCLYFQWAGEYSPNSKEFPGLLTDLVEHVYRKWRKRTLVLFTSRRALEKCYREIVSRGLTKDLDLFVQFELTSRTSLLSGFKNSSNGILLGTRSFWEGVDLPSDLLEILIVTKLPFDVPTDPIIEAYNEKIQADGENPFLTHSVPEAGMTLRQGFGRLIRSTHDEGIFINMDNRVVKRRYGLYFQKAIPVSMQLFQKPSDL